MRHSRRGWWAAGAVVLGLLLFGPGLIDSVRMSLKQQALQRRLREVAAETARLEAERQRLQTDPVYVEGLIRRTLKVARKGEFVIPSSELLDSGGE
jgi:cell division protein FtsB